MLQPDLTDLPKQAAIELARQQKKARGQSADPAVAADAQKLHLVLKELSRRQMDALRLFDPLPMQRAFFDSMARIRLPIGSNRSGKTTSAAVEFATIVRGLHPLRAELPKHDGEAIVVGKDEDHLGQVIFKKLFRPGAFKMIRDAKTSQWRAVKGNDPSDLARRAEWKPSPPLIPPSAVKSWAWSDKKRHILSKIVLHNGWAINFYGGKSDPPQGSTYHVAWFDEEITNEAWWPEVAARGTVDEQGACVIWSATPQFATDRLYQLHERAIDPDDKDVEEFPMVIDDNPHLDPKAKQQFFDSLTPGEREIRYYGQWAMLGRKVYGEFNMALHGVDPFAIPPNATRYMVVDPGRRVCAVLFAAILPPPRHNEVHIYKELYLKLATADIFASRVKASLLPGETFESFVIDWHGGRVTQMGSGETVEYQYSRALAKYGVSSRLTGNGFIWGTDDTNGRELKLHSWMQIPLEGGTPRLRIHRGHCESLCWEIDRQIRKQAPDGRILDERINRDNHAVDCLEYLAGYEPKWVAPPQQTPATTGALGALNALRRMFGTKGPENLPMMLGPMGGDHAA